MIPKAGDDVCINPAWIKVFKALSGSSSSSTRHNCTQWTPGGIFEVQGVDNDSDEFGPTYQIKTHDSTGLNFIFIIKQDGRYYGKWGEKINEQYLIAANKSSGTQMKFNISGGSEGFCKCSDPILTESSNTLSAPRDTYQVCKKCHRERV